MSNAVHLPYTHEQITAWLRGLLTIAWADGDFEEHEKSLIVALTEDELAPSISLDNFEPISGQDLAKALGSEIYVRENFLRTAVMVAVADGIYTVPEDEVLHDFCEALELQSGALMALRATLEEFDEAGTDTANASGAVKFDDHKQRLDVLDPVKHWLDDFSVHDPRVARFLCKMIPSQCPFERDISLFGHKVVHIPPLCKLNPLYDQLVGLRFRALSFLADDCGEDVTPFV